MVRVRARVRAEMHMNATSVRSALSRVVIDAQMLARPHAQGQS